MRSPGWRLAQLLGGSLFGICVLLAVLASGCGETVQRAVTGTTIPTPASSSRRAQVVTITEVVDGDTFEAQGIDKAVRLIGVDTPEVYGGVDCGGREASAHLKRTLREGLTVRLVFEQAGVAGGGPDPRPAARRDRFGRTLAYVYLTDGTFLNRQLVAEGWGVARYYHPNNDHRQALADATRAARAAGRGGWGPCASTFARQFRP